MMKSGAESTDFKEFFRDAITYPAQALLFSPFTAWGPAGPPGRGPAYEFGSLGGAWPEGLTPRMWGGMYDRGCWPSGPRERPPMFRESAMIAVLRDGDLWMG